MYNKVDTNLNFVEREKEIEKFWEEHDIFKKQVHQHEDADVFTFYDGPPTANGKPHIGWMDKVYDGTDHDRCTEGKSGYECHPASLFQPGRSA